MPSLFRNLNSHPQFLQDSWRSAFNQKDLSTNLNLIFHYWMSLLLHALQVAQSTMRMAYAPYKKGGRGVMLLISNIKTINFCLHDYNLKHKRERKKDTVKRRQRWKIETKLKSQLNREGAWNRNATTWFLRSGKDWIAQLSGGYEFQR